eukprot:m51a1_g7712 hypothetical protein (396) ;mRNA; f:111689-112876
MKAIAALLALAAIASASSPSFTVWQNPGRGMVKRVAGSVATVQVDTCCDGANTTRCFVKYAVLDNFGDSWASTQTKELDFGYGWGSEGRMLAWTTNLTMPAGSSQVLEFVAFCTRAGETVFTEGESGNGAFEPATRPRFDVMVANGYQGTITDTVRRGTAQAVYTVDALYMPYSGPRPVPGLRCYAWFDLLARHGDAWAAPRAAEMAYQSTWTHENGMTHDTYLANITFPDDGRVLEVTSFCEMAGRRVWNSGARCSYDREPAVELVQVTPSKGLRQGVVVAAAGNVASLSFRSRALPLSPIRPATGLRCFAVYSFVDSFGAPWRSQVTQQMAVQLWRYGHAHDSPDDLPFELWGLDIPMPPNTNLEANAFCSLNGKTLWIEGQGNFLFHNPASN